jgi:hypothetical protein
MHRTMSRRLGFAVLIVLAVTVGESAARKVPKAKKVRAAAATEVFQALRTAHTLLAEANHDYDGHRALAAKEVHRAIVELRGKKAAPAVVDPAKAAAKAGSKPAAGAAGQHEPQEVSDGQLRQAQQLLQQALSVVTSAGRGKAAGQIRAAVGEIDAALTIK